MACEYVINTQKNLARKKSSPIPESCQSMVKELGFSTFYLFTEEAQRDRRAPFPGSLPKYL